MRSLRILSLIAFVLFATSKASAWLILVPIGPSNWAGYEFEEGWWVDTGEFLGWINPSLRRFDYVYVVELDAFIFMPASRVTEEGAWGFVFDGVERPTGIDPEFAWGGFPAGGGSFHDTGRFLGAVKPVGDFVFLSRLGRFVYLPEGHVDGIGSWVYFYR